MAIKGQVDGPFSVVLVQDVHEKIVADVARHASGIRLTGGPMSFTKNLSLGIDFWRPSVRNASLSRA